MLGQRRRRWGNIDGLMIYVHCIGFSNYLRQTLKIKSRIIYFNVMSSNQSSSEHNVARAPTDVIN